MTAFDQSRQTSCRCAVFDVDDTLIVGDSFMPFLRHFAPKPALLAVAARTAVKGFINRETDLRTRLKEQLIARALTGVTVSLATDAALSMRQNFRRFKPDTWQALQTHLAQGDHVILATGALDAYIDVMMADLGVHQILSTRLAVEKGCYTGQMAGPNMVRLEKAKAVKATIETLRQTRHVSEVIGYGNAPHDLPMLALCDSAHIIPV